LITHIQPVPAAIASPVPLTKEVIPSRLEYIVAPGVNTLVPISINQINRLVTPFEHPVVQKVKQEGVTVNVKDNALYVSTSDSNPASLYISEKGDESVAISVSLVPQKIAPVQATLMLSMKAEQHEYFWLCLRHITTMVEAKSKPGDGNRKIITSRRFAT
jgi:conjugal transfer pilus assembly protein TraK